MFTLLALLLILGMSAFIILVVAGSVFIGTAMITSALRGK